MRTSCPGQLLCMSISGFGKACSRSVLWKAELPTAHFPLYRYGSNQMPSGSSQIYDKMTYG